MLYDLVYRGFAYREQLGQNIADVRYSQSGKYLFFIDTRYLIRKDDWIEKLYKANTDLKNKKLLHEGDIENLEISPSGNYVMFIDYDKHPQRLIIIDTKSLKTKLVKEINDPYLNNPKYSYPKYPFYPNLAGWFPKGEKIWYMRKNKIYLLDIESNEEKMIMKGNYIGLAWSEDGRYFTYTTYNGRPASNSLYLLDAEKNIKTLLVKEQSGFFEHALIDSEKGIVFYVLTYKKDNSAEICLVDVDNFHKVVLWSRKSRYEKQPVEIDKLMFANDRKSLIFNMISSEDEPDKEDGVYLILLSDNKVKKVIPLWFAYSNAWDYSPTVNKVVWYASLDIFKEKEVKW